MLFENRLRELQGESLSSPFKGGSPVYTFNHRAYSARISRILLLGVGWGGGVSSDPGRLRTIFWNPGRISKTWPGSAAGENFWGFETEIRPETVRKPYIFHEIRTKNWSDSQIPVEIIRFLSPKQSSFMDSIIIRVAKFQFQHSCHNQSLILISSRKSG